MSDSIVIVSHARTPIGEMLGCFGQTPAAQLGAASIKGALERSGLKPEDIDDVVMGCVLPAGQGQAPARQAAIFGGLPKSAGATTINKMCGSGMKAIMFAMDALIAGSSTISIAGGMENMSLSPYLLPKARAGHRMGHGQVMDSMFLDGLEDAYERGLLMGVFAEKCVDHYKFTREEQDNFALASLERAQKAIKEGYFKAEIVPVEVNTRKATLTIDTDELPGNARPDKIPQLRPAFKKDGSVTAANASAISDGACAHVMMRESEAQKRGLTPIARIVDRATHAHEPEWFTTAPVGAMKKLLDKTSWQMKDVDLFEVNEAFACVTLAAMKELDIPHDKVNIHGGACALGHPIGASGARITSTLIEALRRNHLKRGIASLCIGGGEATALAIELI